MRETDFEELCFAGDVGLCVVELSGEEEGFAFGVGGVVVLFVVGGDLPIAIENDTDARAGGVGNVLCVAGVECVAFDDEVFAFDEAFYE